MNARVRHSRYVFATLFTRDCQIACVDWVHVPATHVAHYPADRPGVGGHVAERYGVWAGRRGHGSFQELVSAVPRAQRKPALLRLARGRAGGLRGARPANTPGGSRVGTGTARVLAARRRHRARRGRNATEALRAGRRPEDLRTYDAIRLLVLRHDGFLRVTTANAVLHRCERSKPTIVGGGAGGLRDHPGRFFVAERLFGRLLRQHLAALRATESPPVRAQTGRAAATGVRSPHYARRPSVYAGRRCSGRVSVRARARRGRPANRGGRYRLRHSPLFGRQEHRAVRSAVNGGLSTVGDEKAGSKRAGARSRAARALGRPRSL